MTEQLPKQNAVANNNTGAAGHHRLRTYDGAVAIITGGASGIGKAIAQELTKKGAGSIVLVDRQANMAEQFAEELRSIGSSKKKLATKVYEVDVRNYSDVERVVKETMKEYGRIDFIFNNAGVAIPGPLEKTTVEDYNYVLDVNIRGVTNGIQAVYPIMKGQGFGHIVNTGSVAGLMCTAGNSAYATSKWAVVGLSTSLRAEAATYGIRVSVLCPGIIDTPILDDCGKYGKNSTDIPSNVMDRAIKDQNPMDPKKFASRALKLVARNKAIIVLPSMPWKLVWFLNRLSPSLGIYMGRKFTETFMNKLRKGIHDNKQQKLNTDNKYKIPVCVLLFVIVTCYLLRFHRTDR